MYLKAVAGSPPLQPLLCLSQETICRGPRTINLYLVLINASDSIASVAAKAQQLPQEPWFLTGVMAFLLLQSTSSAVVPLNTPSSISEISVGVQPVYCLLNSSSVRSANGPMP